MDLDVITVKLGKTGPEGGPHLLVPVFSNGLSNCIENMGER